MKKLVVMMIAVVTASTFVARHESIESDREFDRKLNTYTYSVACFADSGSDAGRRISRSMRSAANFGDFGKTLRDKVGFLFVRTERDKNYDTVRRYGYTGQPFCSLFEGDYKIKDSDLDRDFSERSIRHFIKDELRSDLQNLVNKIEDEREEERSYDDDNRPRVHFGIGTGYYPGYYGYHRPWGWGYGRRWGHPYYRGYHRPGFHFGISS